MLSSVTIVKRAEVPAIFEVVEGGQVHTLGELRQLRGHPAITEFMDGSPNMRLAMSWTHLKPGQVLDPHLHPIRSMVLICGGAGKLLGQRNAQLEEGDAVLVPPGLLHGFEGMGPSGLSALTVQFEGGLYEDEHRPKVAFPQAQSAESLGAARVSVCPPQAATGGRNRT